MQYADTPELATDLGIPEVESTTFLYLTSQPRGQLVPVGAHVLALR